ncbi:stalk domain-containing protein [Intestinibacillus massiliensis]
MKKKAIALLLTAALLCGLGVPALAADTNPPLYQQWGYSTAQEFMDNWGISGVSYDWVSERYQYYLPQLQQNPDMAFDRAYQGWGWGMVDTYFSSREEFLRDAATQLARLDAYEYLPPMQVQVNGRKVDFTQGQPEMKDSCAMAPVRLLVEALGGEMEYFASAEVVQIELNGNRVTVGMGGTVLDAWRGGAQESVGLDVPPYEKDGQMYVPVRPVCEALGLDVGWDEGAQAVVVLDGDSIAADIDRSFTILNRFLASAPGYDADKTYRSAFEVAGVITRFDTIDGDRTYPIKAKATVLSHGYQMQMDMEFDLASLVSLVSTELGSWSRWLQADYAGQMETLQHMLKDGKLQLILNVDEDTLYVKTTAMKDLLSLAAPEGKIPAVVDGAWFKITNIGLAGKLQSSMPFEENGNRTFGQILYRIMAGNLRYDASKKYSEMMADVQTLRGVLGDQQFTKSGSTYTVKVDKSVFVGQEEALSPFGLQNWLKEFEGKLTFNEVSGAGTATLRCRIGMPTNGSDILLTMDVQYAKGKGEARYALHLQNQMKCELTLHTEVEETDETVLTEPPEGALVIDLKGLMDAWTPTEEQPEDTD